MMPPFSNVNSGLIIHQRCGKDRDRDIGFCHFNSFVKASLVLLMTGDSLSPHYLKVNLAEVICYMTFSMDG